MNNSHIDILQLLLGEIGIKYTHSYLRQLCVAVPYNQSLWGLKTILKLFGVASEGVRFNDKNELRNQKAPFVANIDEGLCIVLGINGDKIEYGLSPKNKKTCSIYDFQKKWDGTVLLPYEDNLNEEYNFSLHKKEETNALIRRILYILVAIIFISFIVVRMTRVCLFWQEWTILIVCTIGLVLSFLLLQEQIFAENPISEKLCGMVKDGNCKSITHSNAAKIIGNFSWSEIGFSFYITHIACLLCLNGMTGMLATISMIALPYPIWSIWYQKYKAHTWCMLCVFVQLTIIILGVLFISMGNFEISIPLAINYGIIFITILLCCNKVMSLFESRRNEQLIRSAFTQLKLTDNVLESISTEEHRLRESPDLTTSIVFGNPNADIRITIFGNLHCYPCAELHNALRWIQNKNCCIRYYFTTLNDKYIKSAKYVIAYYQQYGEHATKILLDDWYNNILATKEPTYIDTDINTEAKDVITEMEKHSKWMAFNKMLPTPRIFINERRLPSKYSLEDLIAII